MNNLPRPQEYAYERCVKLGATKTAEVAETSDTPFDKILASAITEIGKSKVVSEILKTKQPYWAAYAVDAIPDLGLDDSGQPNKLQKLADNAGFDSPHREKISPEEEAKTAVGIRYFELELKFGVGYAACFSIIYLNPGSNAWMPRYPGQLPKDRSGTVNVGQSSGKIDCNKWGQQSPSIEAGAAVKMILYIWCGETLIVEFQDYEFTYDPGSTRTAIVSGLGTTYDPHLSLSFAPSL